MILFATRYASKKKLETHCLPGVRASVHEDYAHYLCESTSEDIFPTLQSFIEWARAKRDAEALVLLHDDLELRDSHLAEKVRKIVADPSIAVAGVIGARDVKSLYWWEGSPRFGHVVDGLHGLYDWGFEGKNLCDVDSVDGMLLVLTPWAISNLNLAGLGYCGLHGYSEELCFQARAAGKRVVVAPLDVMHHTKGGVASEPEAWHRSNEIFQRRWAA